MIQIKDWVLTSLRYSLFWTHHNKNRAAASPNTPLLRPPRIAQIYVAAPHFRYGALFLVYTHPHRSNSEPRTPCFRPLVLLLFGLESRLNQGALAVEAVSTARVGTGEYSGYQRGRYQAPRVERVCPCPCFSPLL